MKQICAVFFGKDEILVKLSLKGYCVTMATSLPSCLFIQFLEQLLKFLVNFTLLKYVKSQRSYCLLITKELIFGFQILDLKDHFSASLTKISEKHTSLISL